MAPFVTFTYHVIYVYHVITYTVISFRAMYVFNMMTL